MRAPLWSRATRVALTCLLLLLLPALGRAAELKIATWNLNWLTLRPAGDRALPSDVHPRAPEDFDRLRAYAVELDADVIGIQEVDGREAAMRVFPADRYSIHMTRDHVVQRVGIVVRRGLRYDVNPDATGIELQPGRNLRSGADITLHVGSALLRILAVHLKTGCHDQRLTDTRNRSCLELSEQLPPLQAWIAARRDEGVPFLVLGDFNRHMERNDQFWAALHSATPLTRATEGRVGPCWGREGFIDHIIAGGAARDWIQPETLRVQSYRETGEEWKDRLSDHCPVSVQLKTPD